MSAERDVLAEAERLLDLAVDAALGEFCEEELDPALVRVREVIRHARRVAELRGERGKPLSVVNRDALARLLAQLEQLRDVLAGVPDAA